MVMLRPESEMKNSGIEWVGQVPKNWKVVKNNRLFRISKTLVGEKWENTQLLSLTKGGIIEKDINDGGGKQPESFSTYQFVQKDDIVLCLFDIDVSAVFSDRSLYDGMISPAYRVMKCSDNILPEYAKWWFDAVNVGRYYLIYTKSLRKTIDSEGFGNILTAVPPLSEQHAIASYLDDRCSKLDEIIAEAEKSIEEYKELKQAVIDRYSMFGTNKDIEIKDTNFSWFPKMPSNWKLVRANRLFKEDVRPVQEGDVSLSLSQIDGLIPTDDMNERSLKSATHDNWKHVIPDDLVLNRFKGHLGVFFASKYEGMVSFHYGVYHAIREGVLSNYYEYLFHSTTYKSIFALMSNGITVGLQNLSNSNFYSVKLLLPPIEEQIAIVKQLDERTSQINTLISEKQSLIEDLKAYKKSLIYEVVTGKRRVV